MTNGADCGGSSDEQKPAGAAPQACANCEAGTCDAHPKSDEAGSCKGAAGGCQASQ